MAKTRNDQATAALNDESPPESSGSSTRSPVEKLRERARAGMGLDREAPAPQPEPSAAESAPAQSASDVAASDVAASDVAASDVAASDVAASDAAGPDATGPDATATPPAVETTDAGQPGAPDWQIAPSAVNFEDPLLSCLSIIAGLIQKPVSEQALKAGLPHAGGRFTPELAMEAAQRAGLGARLVSRPKVASIQPLTLPCILLLKAGGACVLLDFPTEGMAEIAYPEGGGNKVVSHEELQEQYTGYAIYVRAEFKFDSRSSNIELSEKKTWFWGTLSQFWPIYQHVAIASVMINLFAIASPLFIMNVYDRVVPNNALETLWVLALGVTIVFAFEFVMRNLRTYFVDTAGKNADVIIASRLLRHVMAMRLDQKPPSTGALANNLREFESLRDFFTSGTLVAFIDLPFVFLFVAIIYLVAGPIAFVPLLVIPIVIGAGLLLQVPLQKVTEATHRESSQKNALLFETIDGLETIKATGAEGRVQRAWERFVGLTAQSAGKAHFLSGLATTTAQVAIQMTTVVVVVYGVHRIAEGEITMGALIAATILTGRALQPLGAVATMLTRLQQSRVALKALDTLMNTPVERPDNKTFLHRPHLRGEIEIKNASFTYPGQAHKALDGLSLSIQPGEKIGILGRVGSGKSTIARLMLGLYEPAEGAIQMDGTDIRQIDPADLRRNIGYVSQDNYLFFGTVRDNIAFGAPHVDDVTIARAAEVAGVSDFLAGHPMGFDLQVGERGMALSGGQRQAVVIARALLQDPPILMLDEPTSSMDNASEGLFKARLSSVIAGKTLLLVTHRGSMLSLVDRLIVVEGGKIVADGPKEDVLKALKSGQVRAAAQLKMQAEAPAEPGKD